MLSNSVYFFNFFFAENENSEILCVNPVFTASLHSKIINRGDACVKVTYICKIAEKAFIFQSL